MSNGQDENEEEVNKRLGINLGDEIQTIRDEVKKINGREISATGIMENTLLKLEEIQNMIHANNHAVNELGREVRELKQKIDIANAMGGTQH